MDAIKSRRDAEAAHEPLARDTQPETVAAWELVENGRYRPRRIKGSCLGRELG